MAQLWAAQEVAVAQPWAAQAAAVERSAPEEVAAARRAELPVVRHVEGQAAAGVARHGVAGLAVQARPSAEVPRASARPAAGCHL